MKTVTEISKLRGEEELDWFTKRVQMIKIRVQMMQMGCKIRDCRMACYAQ